MSGWFIEFFEEVLSEFDFKTILEANNHKITWIQINEQVIQEENDKSEQE